MSYNFPEPAFIVAYKAKHHITNQDLADASEEPLSFVERWTRVDGRYRPCPLEAWAKVVKMFGE